jgi:hypothetical protein
VLADSEIWLSVRLGAMALTYAVALSEQRATPALEFLDFLSEFFFRRLKIRGHARQAEHPFNLSVYDFPVKSDFVLG